MKVKAASFGRYLLDRGVLPEAQLEQATQVMVVFGGRLGTVLVEAGHLTQEQVEAQLSAYLGFPVAPPDQLHQIDAETLASIPEGLVRRHRVLPMWSEKRRLHVAMLDPQDPDCVDELAFVTECGIRPYVIAERRLAQLRERYYGIRLDARFTDVRILEMAGHVKSGGDRVAPEARSDARPARSESGVPDEEALRERDAAGLAPLEEGEELSALDLLDAVASCGSTPREPESTATRDAAEVARLEQELTLVADRESVVRLTLRIAACFARTVALFGVRDEMIHGIAAAGEAATGQIDGIFVPVSAPGMLAGAAAGGASFRGQPAADGIDALVVERVCRQHPAEAAVLPVKIQGRVVNLLYVDNVETGLAETSLAALEALCAAVSGAYSRLVLESKRRHLQDPGAARADAEA
jgi:hypothetical protein